MHDSKIHRLISDGTVKAEYQFLAYIVHIHQCFWRGVLHNVYETNMLIVNQFVGNRQLT